MRIKGTRKAQQTTAACKVDERKEDVKAEDELVEVEDEVIEDPELDYSDVEMMFDVTDVIDILEEATDADVEAEVDDDGEFVTFFVDDQEITVEPDGTEEVMESSTRKLKGKASVTASKKLPRRKMAARRVRK